MYSRMTALFNLHETLARIVKPTYNQHNNDKKMYGLSKPTM